MTPEWCQHHYSGCATRWYAWLVSQGTAMILVTTCHQSQPADAVTFKRPYSRPCIQPNDTRMVPTSLFRLRYKMVNLASVSGDGNDIGDNLSPVSACRCRDIQTPLQQAMYTPKCHQNIANIIIQAALQDGMPWLVSQGTAMILVTTCHQSQPADAVTFKRPYSKPCRCPKYTRMVPTSLFRLRYKMVYLASVSGDGNVFGDNLSPVSA